LRYGVAIGGEEGRFRQWALPHLQAFVKVQIELSI
jgi:hypothetical protein